MNALSGRPQGKGAGDAARKRAPVSGNTGRGYGRVAGVGWEEVDRACELAERTEDLAGRRDAAIVAVGSDALLRVSELEALDVGDWTSRNRRYWSAAPGRTSTMRASCSSSGNRRLRGSAPGSRPRRSQGECSSGLCGSPAGCLRGASRRRGASSSPAPRTQASRAASAGTASGWAARGAWQAPLWSRCSSPGAGARP